MGRLFLSDLADGYWNAKKLYSNQICNCRRRL